MMTTVNKNLSQPKRRTFDYILNIVIAIFAVIVIFELVFSMNHRGIYVVHSSMYPTLSGATDQNSSGGDYVYANTSVAPDYGDIIVINDTRHTNITLIKRVIAFEGDTVRIDNGRVYIMYSGEDDFTLLEESYVATECNLRRGSYPALTLEEGEIYLLGDNRDVSDDSRQNGAFWISDLVGVVTDWSLSMRPFTTMIYNLMNF